jgi:hypothetical protein
MELFLAWSMVYLTPSRKERLEPKQEERQMSRGRCQHTTYPVEVLPVDGDKKIACCLGCGRSGPVCKSSTEALTALREMPRLDFQQRTA